MGVTLSLAEFFLISLGLGVGLFSFLAKTEETGAGLLKVVAGVCMGGLFIGEIIHLVQGGEALDSQSILYFISLLSFLFIYLFHQDKKSPVMWLLYFFHNISLVALLYLFSNKEMTTFIYTLSSILLLGPITYAMIMGHWYLVTPKLSEKPLKIALYFTWVILALKLVWTGWGWTQAGEYFITGTMKGGGYSFNWMMFLMRVIWGYLVIGVMSFYGYRLVAMRSIQSATGILYAMTFFVFMGELISTYLFFKYGLYL